MKTLRDPKPDFPTIFRYNLPAENGDVQTIHMPHGHRVLSCAKGRTEEPSFDVWVEVWPSHNFGDLTVYIVGTGKRVPFKQQPTAFGVPGDPEITFIGTVVMTDDYVFHLYYDPTLR